MSKLANNYENHTKKQYNLARDIVIRLAILTGGFWLLANAFNSFLGGGHYVSLERSLFTVLIIVVGIFVVWALWVMFKDVFGAYKDAIREAIKEHGLFMTLLAIGKEVAQVGIGLAIIAALIWAFSN